MRDNKKYIEIFEKVYCNNNIEEVLSELKKEGASQLQCTRLLMINLKLNLTDADNIVINLKAWKEEFNAVKELRESFFNIDFEEYFGSNATD